MRRACPSTCRGLDVAWWAKCHFDSLCESTVGAVWWVLAVQCCRGCRAGGTRIGSIPYTPRPP